MATKAPATKTRVTKAQVTAHRTKAVKDHSPTWEGCETMDADKFMRHWHGAMEYYRMEFSGKDLKPAVLKWMISVNAAKDEVATDAHWGSEMTYDYFDSEHGRNSFDNNGAKILSYIHYGSNYNNAFWNGSVMTY